MSAGVFLTACLLDSDIVVEESSPGVSGCGSDTPRSAVSASDVAAEESSFPKIIATVIRSDAPVDI